MPVKPARPVTRTHELIEPGLSTLIRICHRGWAIPILAHMGARPATRTAELAHALDAPRGSIRTAVDGLVSVGLARRWEGHAHPLRPEISLANAGTKAALYARALMEELDEAGAAAIARRKWSLPVVAALDGGETRFGELRNRLPTSTDRALSQALRLLAEHELVARSVSASWPPAVHYTVTPTGQALSKSVQRLASALPAVA